MVIHKRYANVQVELEGMLVEMVKDGNTDYSIVERLVKVVKEVDALREEAFKGGKFGEFEEMAQEILKKNEI